MLLSQLAAIRIQVEWSHRVVSCHEDISAGQGGVVLDSGEKLEADLVVATDGVGTRSHGLVVGRMVEAKSVVMQFMDGVSG